ncbi:hypothetical protein EDB87DRAFT_1575315 [Lactarius vividus]|nr:hypothetical protein EDB87DRAFT_1575315 [Lactarius vividus]
MLHRRTASLMQEKSDTKPGRTLFESSRRRITAGPTVRTKFAMQPPKWVRQMEVTCLKIRIFARLFDLWISIRSMNRPSCEVSMEGWLKNTISICQAWNMSIALGTRPQASDPRWLVVIVDRDDGERTVTVEQEAGTVARCVVARSTSGTMEVAIIGGPRTGCDNDRREPRGIRATQLGETVERWVSISKSLERCLRVGGVAFSHHFWHLFD